VFLKTLEIFGFKSFADHTRIEFSDGVTALLGPNGCGKSNVVDSIKWVLGEQATKTLRAEAMEDVIFNGTEARRAVNVAEVALTLANDSGILPIDLPEVVVRRRLYRSGESEYFVNNAPVKLKELRELFFDTGIGKSAYSIMEQGKIDQVLSHKPEERRNLFEEAASITKYKMRGLEAERKLEKTDENMRQVENILVEVRRSYDNLKKQAERTTRYRVIRDELFEFEINLQLLRLRDAQAERDKRGKQLEELRTERDTLKTKIDAVNEHLEENLGQVSTMESRLVEAQKNLYALELDMNTRDGQVRMFEERIQEIKLKIEGDRSREEAVARKADSVRQANAERETQIADLTKHIGEMDEGIKRLEDGVELSRKGIVKSESDIVKLEAAIDSVETNTESIQAQLRELTDRIVSQLDASLKDQRWNPSERDRLSRELDRELETLRILLSGRRKLVDDARNTSGGTAAVRALEAASQAFSDADAGLEKVSLSIRAFKASLPAFIDELVAPEGTLTRKRDFDAHIDKNREKVAENRKAIGAHREAIEQANRKIVESRDALENIRVSRAGLVAQQDSLVTRREQALQELHELEVQRHEIARVLAEDEGRIKGLETQIAGLRKDRTDLEEREKSIRLELVELEKGITNRNKDVVNKEKELKAAMGILASQQDRFERTQVTYAEAVTEIKGLYENFRDRHSRDLQEFESRMPELTMDPKELREKSALLREEQRTLGSVNLMAVEEFAEVRERYDFLRGQLDDLRKAKDDLEKVTEEIRTESSQLFVETYEKIRVNFHTLFRRLFGGGRAELRLTDPDDVLESGIDIFAQPPGKKLENIALLSGGERSMTAVALLFATYMVKPSPFCLLDEIDAALDESNVGRFVTMLMEFAHSSQFIVITHNKKTVVGARALLGVTMEESGVSKIVAIRLAEGPVADKIEEHQATDSDTIDQPVDQRPES